MSSRIGLYNKYVKSDIFNCNATTKDSEIKPHLERKNGEDSNINSKRSNFKTIDDIKKKFHKKYMSNYHQSDIFNANKSFDAPTKPKVKKIRGLSYISTCFDSMKDNEQFSKDIKEYTEQNRADKTKYEPDKYYHNEEATERLYDQLYDKNRNPITNNNNIPMKSSINIFKDAKKGNKNNIDDENNEKNLFLERKKKMSNQFTKKFFDQRNIEEKMKLEQETEKAVKTHRYNKSKGFITNNENNSINQNRFITPDKYQKCSKINKQMQLQSNLFKNEETKNENIVEIIENRLNKIKKIDDENKPEKMIFRKKAIFSKKMPNTETDRNQWGSINNKWEKSNLDWRNTDTELIFGKTYTAQTNKNNGKNMNNSIEYETPFQKKMNQLQDSGYRDTINESLKERRKFTKSSIKDKLNRTYDLEKINEILDEIPNDIMKLDKKKKIMFNANTSGLNGETGVNDNFINYNKFHKNILKKKEIKEPKIKIMSKTGDKNIKKIDKNLNNVKKHDDYNIHDFVLSYDSNPKNEKNSFDKFSENEIKLLFSKKGIHAYNIQKNQFDNRKYNVIKFRVRENEGEASLVKKIKEIENDFKNKEYKICIEKDVEKETKKNLKHIVNVPRSKVAMFSENDKKNTLKKKEPLQIKNQSKFTKQFNLIDHKYKTIKK